MIASVDKQRDFDIYLTHEEVKAIANQVVEGALIRVHKPKQQGRLYICVDDSKRNLNGFGIGVEDNWPWRELEGKVQIFVGNSFYNHLIENKRIGTRYGHMGSKVHLYDCSNLDGIEEMGIEMLEHYRDNQEKLDPRLG